MVDRVGVLANPVVELFVGVGIGRRCPLLAIRSQCGLGQNFLSLANPVAQALQVTRGAQKLRVNQRRTVRVAVGQLHAASAVGLQQTHMQRVAMAQCQLAAVVHQFGHHKVQLNVRVRHLRSAVVKGTALGEVRGEAPLSVLVPGPQGLPGVPHPFGRHANQIGLPRRIGHQHCVRVVVQVFAHARQVAQHLDALALQMRGWPNA